MTPLDRAVTLAEPHDLSVIVRQDLHLDVACVPDLPLEIERRRSEGSGRLAGRAPPGGLEVLVAADDAHPLTSATAGRFQQHRITDLLRRGAGRGGVAQRLRALRDRHIDRTR